MYNILKYAYTEGVHSCISTRFFTIFDKLEMLVFCTAGGTKLPRTACRRGTPRTSPTRTKLAENLWNTFERLRATWISVELRNLLVTRHDPINVPKNWSSKNSN